MVRESQSPQLFLDVAPESLRVERGEEGAFLVTIENRGSQAQAQSIEINGLARDWYRMEFDSRRRAFPGERRTASLLVTVPRDADAANISFGIVARAGSDESSVACSLEVTAGGQAAPRQTPPPAPAALPPPPGLSLSPAQVQWRGEAQGSETLTLSVRNVSGDDAEYALALDGLASHWFTIAGRIVVPARQAAETSIVVTPPAQARRGDYTLRVSAVLVGNDQVRGEVTGRFTIAQDTETARAPQRPVGPIVVEETPPSDRGDGTPVLPPEVSLSPRTTFRFGPGEVTAQAMISVTNRSRLIERYQILVRGIDEDWYQLANNEVRLEPGASIQVPLRLTPRTGAQFPAGDYSFRVRVSPHSFPDSFAEVGGVVAVAGVASFDARLTPAQTTGRKEKFKLTLVNTGGVPLSPWLEAGDPQGLCKFKYQAPSNLEVGQETVVPVWVGATRQGFAGSPKTLDFRLRVSPAGAGAAAARSFDARFVHQPFLSGRTFMWSLLIALIAAIVGMILVLGTSSIGRAATSIRCGFDDDFQEPNDGAVLIKEECDGAPTALQKGFFSPDGNGDGLLTPTAVVTETLAPVDEETPTPAPGDCVGDPALGIAVGDEVKLRVDAIVRDAPAGEDTRRRGRDMEGVVTAGPECAEDLVWWEVETADGTGWTAEQDQNKVRLILDR